MKKIIVSLLSSALVLSSSLASNKPWSAKNLSDAQMLDIGDRIWQNQSGGSTNGITTWVQEGPYQYAEIGINQALWYDADNPAPFREDWPDMALYLKKHGFPIQDWMLSACPWSNATDFAAAFDGDQLTLLRTMLSTDDAVVAQTRFIAKRLDQSLPTMMALLPSDQATQLQNNFDLIAQQPLGFYALIDYVNFKGEGTCPTEQVNGQGWGLLQVLQEMQLLHDQNQGTPGYNATPMEEFVAAAKTILQRRIDNSDPSLDLSQYWDGWCARLDTYLANDQPATTDATQPQ